MIKIGLTDYTPEDKLIQIKGKDKKIKALYSIGKDDINKRVLMDEHFIQISFELNKYIAFKRSDYIDFKSERYTLREDYTPIQENKRKYKYTLLFETKEMFFQDIDFYYLNQSLKEATWSITTNPATIFQIAVDNINRYFGTNKYNLGTIEPTEIKLLQFDKVKVFDGLTQTAKEHNAEWYLTGYTLHLVKKVSFGSEIPFETDVSITNMSREKGEGEKPITRMLALGSTRNLPANYRESCEGEAVDAIYQKRLRIPAEYGDVIDAYPGMLPEEVIEGTVIFDEVYPKRIGEISNVHTVEYTDTNEDTGEITKWKAYRYKDEGLKFKEEYLLPDVELRLIFQSGNLNGLDFAVKFNPDNIPEDDPRAQVFEIYRTDEYGSFLPNELMKPENGNKYILYGFNIDLVGDQYVPQSEVELYQKAVEYQKDLLKDKSVFECPTIIKHFKDKEMDLDIGQRVRLVHEQFEGGKRSSRVQGFEKKLLNPYEAVYTIGDNAVYSRLSEIENNIKELQTSGITTTGGGNGSIYLIKQFDDTLPTDFNAYSAKASNARFLSRLYDDIARGSISFLKNISSGNFIADDEGKGWMIANNGAAQLDSLITRKYLSSPTFVSGFPNGVGWMLAPYKQTNAANVEETKYRLEIDDITVRGMLRVYEFVVSQLLGENDNRIFAGMMEVDHYDPESSRIYLDTDGGRLYNPFREGDICMVQQFQGLPTLENYYYVTKQYEFVVSKAGCGNLTDGEDRLDWIEITNFVGDTDHIKRKDTVTRVDNLWNNQRKGIMKITTIDEFGTPYLDVVYGMKTDPLYSTKVRLGNLGGLVTPYWGRLEGYGLMATNAYLKGRFLLQNGDDIMTKFEITEGLIRSEISSIRTEIFDKDNYLNNASFSANTEKWEAISDISLFTVNGRFLYFNDNFYADKKSLAAIVIEGDRRALRLKKSSIRQLNKDLANKPKTPIENEEGEELWPTFFVSFKYKCVKRGTLKIGFSGSDLFITENLEPNDIFQTFEFSGIWDGEGDFTIEFTGDIFIYSLALSDDSLENFKLEMKTRFYQTDSRIGLMGEKIDHHAQTILQMGLDINLLDETLSIYSKKTDQINGTVVSLGITLSQTNQSLSIYANKQDSMQGTITQLGIDLSTLNSSLSLYVKEKDATGNWMVARINMSPYTVKIEAKNIDLQGKVGFTMLDRQVNAVMNTFVQSHNLGDLAYYNKVEQAMKDETIIVGGFIKTSLIRVNEIIANAATIGNFKIYNGRLEWRDLGDSAALYLGYNSWWNNSCLTAYSGFYGNGITSINAGGGGAAIFASSNSTNPSYPSLSKRYAIYVDGDMVMTRGNIIVYSGGDSEKGVIQADRMLPQNGWSGSFDAGKRRLTLENGIIINVT